MRDRLAEHLDDAVGSFQLMGQDLVRLTGADLADAMIAWKAQVQALPDAVREDFLAQHREHAVQAHGWLTRYNSSLGRRVRGYLALGEVFAFQYPWPIVAILGICEVRRGITQMHGMGILGRLATRLGWTDLERATDTASDVLRRTNRGIFADSVPMCLFALRCFRLAREGRDELCQALLHGPLPPLMDRECRGLLVGLVADLAVADPGARFQALGRRTVEHFDREQAIFGYHMGGHRTQPPPTRDARPPTEPSRVSGPVIEAGWGARRLVFKSTPLPDDLDLRDHARRVEVFGRIYVQPVVANLEDYRVACAWVGRRHRFVCEPDFGGSSVISAVRIESAGRLPESPVRR